MKESHIVDVSIAESEWRQALTEEEIVVRHYKRSSRRSDHPLIDTSYQTVDSFLGMMIVWQRLISPNVSRAWQQTGPVNSEWCTKTDSH